MEDDEIVETMFLRFQMLVVGLKVLDKGYSTPNHVKKIIRSLPKKWRPMVIALKPAKDVNSISLEELSKPEKTKAYQGEKESEGSDEDSKDDDDDELSLISKRVNRLWKHKHNGQGKFIGSITIVGHFDSSSGQKKQGSGKELICFECKESGHCKNDYHKLKKDRRPKKNSYKGKKVSMATTYDPKGSEEPEDMLSSKSESDSDSDYEEVFSNLSHSDLESCLSEMLEKYQSL
ncbi:hypothetical protein KIW84_051803 [Lathyrus oleraceus]|uniref:Uncharacterized protein n=1 Tax=Pisum sativum TaxID=3888 RepID=A0A9D4WNL2_PEA|nr:hypothetical protein KIW84_051803 [Pisum sativum]